MGRLLPKIISSILCLLSPLSVFGFMSPELSVNSSITPEVWKQIDERVSAYHELEDFHGNVLVRLKGQDVYGASRGTANIAFDIPHQLDSRFMIASVSKQFTAAAVMKLVDDGKVNLNALYKTYVPWPGGNTFGEKAWNQIRVRDLLTHTSGAARNVRPTENSNMSTYERMLSSLVEDQLQSSNMFPRPRGGKARYSNFGYVLLAHLVSEVSNKEFHKFLEDAFFKPLGLESTGQYHRMFDIKKFADGIHYDEGSGILKKRCCNDSSNFVGSHGLYSDVKDLSLWLADLSSGQSKVLSQDSINQMWRPQVVLSTKPEGAYGFAFNIEDYHGQKMVWHDGMEFGYLSFTASLPETDLQIVILANRHGNLMSPVPPHTERLAREIIDILSTPQQIL